MINATQIMGLNQSPSYRLALADRLQAQQRGMNNGTWAGGLASMINAGTAGYLRGKDTRDRDAASEALTGGMTEGAQIDGADGMQPNAPRINPGIEGAEARLAALKGNPYAGRLSGMLALSRAEQGQQAQAAQQAFQQQLYRDQMNNQARINAAAAGRSSVNVNTGNSAPQREFFGLPDLPKGYDYQRDQTGAPVVGENGAVQLVPIAGGPNAREIAEVEQKAAKKNEGEIRKTGLVIEDIGRFRAAVENQPWYSPVTGLGGALLSNIPGSGAYDAARVSDTIRANIGFDRLQQMRDESPTGGALGAVNNQEMQLLQSVLGSIDQAQSGDQLLQNLERLDGLYRGMMRKLSAYPNASKYGFGGGGDIGNGITAAPNVDDLLKKYGQ